MPKCDFSKVANFIEIARWHGCFPVDLLHIFRTPLDGCFCNLKWIVGELFHFPNHSKLIGFHILILHGRRWF